MPHAIINLWSRNGMMSSICAFTPRSMTRNNGPAMRWRAACGISLTSKHHDGFCMWPTATNTYNIAATPYGQDVMGPYVAALREAGMMVGIYYSQRDWWWQAERPGLTGAPEQRQHMAAYILAQVEELVERYHPDELWFDGAIGGEVEIDAAVQRLSPVTIVNDRNNPPGCAGAGDYITPEGTVPACPLINPDGSDQLWELATVTDTIGEGGWSYHADAGVRPYREQLLELIEVAAKGGNLLRGFGPNAQGTFSAPNRWVMRKIGRWLQGNGASIFGTHRTKLGQQSSGSNTANADTLFLHVIRWPADTVLQVKDLHDTVASVSLVMTGEPLPWEQDGQQLHIDLPLQPLDDVDTVIAVRIAQ